MTSPKSGHPVANQYEIYTDNGVYFQSYRSIIARKYTISGREYVDLDHYYWNYSRTTSKYRNIFLGESTEETRKKIKTGQYKLVNLN